MTIIKLKKMFDIQTCGDALAKNYPDADYYTVQRVNAGIWFQFWQGKIKSFYIPKNYHGPLGFWKSALGENFRIDAFLIPIKNVRVPIFTDWSECIFEVEKDV